MASKPGFKPFTKRPTLSVNSFRAAPKPPTNIKAPQPAVSTMRSTGAPPMGGGGKC
jgi:hypothetical protein